MRVLTYMPVNPALPRTHPLAVASIDALEWPYPMSVVFGRNDKSTKRKYADICFKHTEARNLALDGNYDALFLAESDMVFPANALQKLVAVDAPVVYGLYAMRYPPYRWLAFSDLSPTDGGTFVSDNADLARQWWGNIVPSCGVGMGCTLIRREALELLAFRDDPRHAVADDWMFALDCLAYGVKQMHHCGVICGHIDGNTVLWPDIDAPGLVRKEPV